MATAASSSSRSRAQESAQDAYNLRSYLKKRTDRRSPRSSDERLPEQARPTNSQQRGGSLNGPLPTQTSLSSQVPPSSNPYSIRAPSSSQQQYNKERDERKEKDKRRRERELARAREEELRQRAKAAELDRERRREERELRRLERDRLKDKQRRKEEKEQERAQRHRDRERAREAEHVGRQYNAVYPLQEASDALKAHADIRLQVSDTIHPRR